MIRSEPVVPRLIFHNPTVLAQNQGANRPTTRINKERHKTQDTSRIPFLAHVFPSSRHDGVRSESTSICLCRSLSSSESHSSGNALFRPSLTFSSNAAPGRSSFRHSFWKKVPALLIVILYHFCFLSQKLLHLFKILTLLFNFVVGMPADICFVPLRFSSLYMQLAVIARGSGSPTRLTQATLRKTQGWISCRKKGKKLNPEGRTPPFRRLTCGFLHFSLSFFAFSSLW